MHCIFYDESHSGVRWPNLQIRYIPLFFPRNFYQIHVHHACMRENIIHWHDLDKRRCTAQAAEAGRGGPSLSNCADKTTIEKSNLQKITTVIWKLQRNTANISLLQILELTSDFTLVPCLLEEFGTSIQYHIYSGNVRKIILPLPIFPCVDSEGFFIRGFFFVGVSSSLSPKSRLDSEDWPEKTNKQTNHCNYNQRWTKAGHCHVKFQARFQ